MTARTVFFVSVLAVAAAAAACALAPPPHRGPPPASNAGGAVALFWNDLAPYGTWVAIEAYGWSWRPAGVPAGWRPYTHGRWVHSDLGWTWVSDWPWGWAPFHYGRWVLDPARGWLWVPGQVWAPAWVAWRYGDGWIGWAPLPPAVAWRAGVGLDLGGLDLSAALGPGAWAFVPERHFLDGRLGPVLAPVQQNRRRVERSRDHTRYEAVGPRIVVRGVDVRDVEHGLGRPVPRLRVEELSAPPAKRAPRVSGGAVRVYRPHAAGRPNDGEGRGARGTRPPRKPPR